MKRKIGISTVYTGFNYGSSLQAYATKTYLSNLGYEVKLLSHKEGIVKGRDIRINKIIFIFLRTFLRPNLLKKTLLTYKNSLKKEINIEIKQEFLKFYDKRLNPSKYTWKQLKEYAKKEETLACICGSDQIWNATNIYIDPIFYLRFAPKYKRIAYAPSFGKDNIPSYNRKIICKYINNIPYISVREEQGIKIVRELINKDVPAVLDPTLLLNKEEWIGEIETTIQKPEKYILVYFLDKPSDIALTYIKMLQEKLNLPLIAIPYQYDEFSILDDLQYKNAGPEQFLDLVNHASFVCTDSFHGMIFSANFNIPFYIFHREYGSAADQSSRIISILNKLGLQDRFISKINNFEEEKMLEVNLAVNFSESNKLLEMERIKSKDYLEQALYKVKTQI